MSATSPADQQGQVVLSALAEQPGGEAVLALARERKDLVLVGGAVRDLLLDRAPQELDVTVADGAAEVAELLAGKLSLPADAEPPRISTFDRFSTACVQWPRGRIDIAQRRQETYPYPGALPKVAPGDLQADLARRDFTLNAIAVPLGGPHAGELQAVEHGLDDLAVGQLRVLHERSFLDDPTRLLRLARYRGRLGFQVEQSTLELAQQALSAGALGTVSRARIGAELWLAVSEAEPLGSLTALDQLGLLSALGLPAPFDRPLAESALELLPSDGRPAELLMAVLIGPQEDHDIANRVEAGEVINGFEIHADARERILASAFDAPPMADQLSSATRPSQLRQILGVVPAEAVALAGALAARRAPELSRAITRWFAELRHVRLRIDGEDILRAGVAQGPEVGLRLAHALDLKLDGQLADSPEAELQAALEAPL